MEIIRKIVTKIGHHPIVSLLGLFFFVGLFFAAHTIIQRNNGLLTPPISKGTVVDSIYGIGTVTANRSYTVKPGVTQTLRALFVKEGDSVKKGDRLLSFDNIDYRAPFDGVVNYLPFKVGENVFANVPALVETALTDDRYLVVSLVQQGAMRVHQGQRAILSFDSNRGKRYEGRVSSVYSYNGSFLARIDVDNLPKEILPDMTADVAVVVNEIKDALIIPTTAFDNGMVWVKRFGAAEAVPVTLGVVDETKAQVVSGDILEGEQLLIRKKVGP